MYIVYYIRYYIYMYISSLSVIPCLLSKKKKIIISYKKLIIIIIIPCLESCETLFTATSIFVVGSIPL